MNRSAVAWASLPLILLAAVLPLRAQHPIAAPPPLPFNLKWTMTEGEVLAALERAGVEMEFVDQGIRYTKAQIRRAPPSMAADMRDQPTWHQYEAEDIRGESLLPAGVLIVEFYRNRPLRFRFALPTSSSSEHLELADSLVEHYKSIYTSEPVEEWEAMPNFPTGKTYGEISMMSRNEHRPNIVRGWSGSAGGRMYGTVVYTDGEQRLAVEQMEGPMPAERPRRGR